MSRAQHVFEGTGENFATLVLENSHKGPILVNFWAAYAGPCLRLYPILEKLVHQYGGRFLLVNVDVDKERAVAQEQGVSSVPNVKLFRNGAVVETVRSYQNEADFRQLIDRHLPRESDRMLVAAVRMYSDGHRERGLQALAELAMADPENLRVPATLAKLLMNERRFEQAYELLNALPPGAKRDSGIGLLLAHLGFIRDAAEASDTRVLEAAIATNPDDLESRYRLSAVRVVNDEFDQALEQLLAILKRDRSFREDAARRGMLAIFQVLGQQHPSTERYQRLMANVLH
jgi:putative thioredoxin